MHTSGKMSLVLFLNAGTLAVAEYPAIQAVVKKGVNYFNGQR